VPIPRQLRFVQRHESASSPVSGKIGHCPLDAVVGDDRDDAAAAHPQPMQTGATAVDPLAELTIGDPLPAPFALGTEYREVGEALAALLCQLREIAWCDVS